MVFSVVHLHLCIYALVHMCESLCKGVSLKVFKFLLIMLDMQFSPSLYPILKCFLEASIKTG